MKRTLDIGDIGYCEVSLEDENSVWYMDYLFEIDKGAITVIDNKTYLLGEATEIDNGSICITLKDGYVTINDRDPIELWVSTSNEYEFTDNLIEGKSVFILPEYTSEEQ